MSRKTMFDSASLEPDDRNFEQQMADLNVPIERVKRKPGRPVNVKTDPVEPISSSMQSEAEPEPEPQLTGVQWIRRSTIGGKTYLGETISVNKYSVGIGQVAAEKMARATEIDTLGFGVLPRNDRQELVIAINGPMGFKTKRSKSGALIMASKTIVDKLIAAGLTHGRYRLDKQYGSIWTAVPAEGK